MAQATACHSTPPTPASAIDHPPPRVPTSQERADELLRRWRLARVAGVPAAVRAFLMADRELTPRDVLADLLGSGDFPAEIFNPELEADLIIDRLRDAGFEIVPTTEARS
jgi:hypothetical protein